MFSSGISYVTYFRINATTSSSGDFFSIGASFIQIIQCTYWICLLLYSRYSPEIMNDDLSYWVIGRTNKINHGFKFYNESRRTYKIVISSLMPNFCLSGFMSHKYSSKSVISIHLKTTSLDHNAELCIWHWTIVAKLIRISQFCKNTHSIPMFVLQFIQVSTIVLPSWVSNHHSIIDIIFQLSVISIIEKKEQILDSTWI